MTPAPVGLPSRRRALWAAGGVGAAAAASLAAAVAAPTRALNALSAIGSRRVAADQRYGALSRQLFDLYRPEQRPSRGWPLLVFFYGGAWNRGERADYRFVGEALAARGMVAMVADYRLHPQVRYPDFLGDCALAVAHAITHAVRWGTDPSRLFVMGHSAGAYNAAMLALDARWLRAAGHERSRIAGWMGLAGPYDFLPIRTPEVQAVFHHPDVPPDSQPIRYAASSLRPCFLGAPVHDERIDAGRNTAGLAAALRAAGTAVTERRYARVGHESLVGAFGWPLRSLAPVLDDVCAFVDAISERAGTSGTGAT